jgi:uncharacterized integral membrane protein
MPWKFVTVLVIVGIVLLFVAFNVNNTSDISFGFYKAEEVPIFLSLFIAFFLGFLVTLPFALSSSSRKTKASLQKQHQKEEKKESRRGRKKKKQKGSDEESTRIAGGGDSSQSS